ncbi:MAG: hypothetical protein ACYCST_07280 [Acidimicrobiales bacterium]
MWPQIDDVALRVGEEVVAYRELLLVGAEAGLFGAALAATTRGLQALESGLSFPTREELRAEAVEYRQVRKLQSGEDLRAFLAARHLETPDWEAHLRRVLAARSPVDVPELAISPDRVAEALRVDLACSGWWRRAADLLERYWAAVTVTGAPSPALSMKGRNPDLLAKAEEIVDRVRVIFALEPQWCLSQLQLLAARQLALAEVEQSVGSEAAVTARIVEHALDWMRVGFDELCLPTRSAAREAVMCSRDEGVEPREIAARAGGELLRKDLRRDQLAPAKAALLGGAIVGEALGPLESAEGFCVLWLESRRPPSIDDPESRAQATSELLGEVLDRVLAGRVTRVGPL